MFVVSTHTILVNKGNHHVRVLYKGPIVPATEFEHIQLATSHFCKFTVPKKELSAEDGERCAHKTKSGLETHLRMLFPKFNWDEHFEFEIVSSEAVKRTRKGRRNKR